TYLGQMSVDALPDYFSVSDYSIVNCFAVVDLNGDGGKEVVLSVTDVAADLGGYMVLYWKDDGDMVYGRPSNWRSFWDLKTDGTFQWSDPTGSQVGFGTFNPDTGEIDPISYAEGPLGQDYDIFVVEGRRTTEAEYWEFSAQQDAKSNAVWYDFTPKNIKAVLQY
ncbi:MAG: hypothetical protein K2K53_03290, partial [Oscillospiraceae bacterium]|nr:hypothetical protein [Oscillospiraceae bacterium]